MSSAVKYDSYQAYKPFEPEYHAQRPIIVGEDALDSPETVTLRYEEEVAARANGGDLRGGSPPGLLSMSTYSKAAQPPPMNGFDSSRSYADHQYSYPPQQFGAPPAENAAAQLNQMAFAANNAAASQYMTHVVPSLISYQPSTGMYGTKVMMKISAPYDLATVMSQVSLVFGSHKVPGQTVRDPSDASGFSYAVSGDAPQHQDTRSPGASVPLTLIIENPSGQAVATIDAGTFTYHDTEAASPHAHGQDVTRVDGLVGAAAKSSEDDVQMPMQAQGQAPQDKDHGHTHGDPASADQLGDAGTNTPYGYSTAHNMAAGVAGYDANVNNAYANTNNNMIGTYHRPSYDYGAHHGHGHHTAHHVRPPPLKTPSWSPYASLSSRSPALSHTSTIPRPSITTLPVPASSAPALVRTSTLQTSGSSANGQYNPYALYSTKAVLKIQGDLQSMAIGWTQEEWANRRRIVMFTKKQQGSTLSTNFKPVTISERPPNSICISCIYWAERNECFVTSVDTISLLEQLVASPARFTVEEKNRIRRNLEGFRPLTVSKAKADSEEFFKIIMAFPNPKPRNIEKDVKVFPWKILSSALKKIIGKYSATPSSTMAPGPSPGALLTPVSNSSPGLYPPPPSHTPSVSDNGAGAYGTHHDAHGLSSPRSLSGTSASANWGTYPASRTLSPNLKPASPQSGVAGAGLRIPSMPSSFGGDGTTSRHHQQQLPQSHHQSSHHGGSSSHHHQQQQQQQQHHTPTSHHYGIPQQQPQHHSQHQQPQSHHNTRWDAVTNGYGDPTAVSAAASAYGAAPTSVAPHHGQVYATNGYGDRD